MDLAPLSLPMEPEEWLGWVVDLSRSGLADAAAHVTALKQSSDGDVAILHRWNDVRISLSNAFAVSALMSAVHPDPAVMEEAERLHLEARSLSTDLYLDADIHARLASVEGADLDALARRYLDDALLAFRRSGVDRDEDTREQLRRLNRRESELTQSFARGIRDGRRTTRLDPADLDGLPADYREDHPVADDGTVHVGTDYPDTIPFLTHATRASARTAVAHSLLNVGWPDNDAVLAELLEVREAKAHLLGYDDWPSFDVEVKMIADGAAIPDFIDTLAAATDETGGREIDALLGYARELGEDVIDFSNHRYFLEMLKRDRFDVDAQELRRYFDFRKVRAGLLDVTSRLFGIRYEQVDAPAWHPEVTSYDVRLEETGELLGRIHLDLHPRDRKYNHAAQFTLVNGVLGRQLPEGALVCNFSRGLMDPHHVVTLFHEFGHLVHHVLAGRHEWARFSGVATEWDFVEAPSQMLEEWAWDASVLQTFATDADGSPLPAELVGRMRAAEEFGKALLTRTQMAYAAISYWFHAERPDDQTARLRELMERYALVQMVPDTHFHAGFGHLEEYTSGYYTYAWSLVIAKDLFSAFDPDDLMAPAVARRYRDCVLAPGGSKDAADLVHDFLGRPYDERAYRAWLERQPEVVS